MKLILKNTVDETVRSLNFNSFENYKNLFDEIRLIKKAAKAVLISAHEKINSHELSNFKLTLEKLNIKIIHIYSNNRETVLSGNSLKINSTLLNKKDSKHELFIDSLHKEKDVLFKGTVRSGNRISSNGDLFIIGDVNPGAIISANNNVYVWGKLLGIALAGKNGDKNSTISSLYLNPLQLRICDIVAIGPKEKPKQIYPEVAVIENKKIIIKPFLIPG